MSRIPATWHPFSWSVAEPVIGLPASRPCRSSLSRARGDQPATWKGDKRTERPESFVVLDLASDLSKLPADDHGSRDDLQYEVPETAWVGLWTNEAGELSEQISFPYSELMIVLDGVATLVDANRREGKLKSGDVVLLPAGVPVRWRTDERFRKLYVSFDPAARSGNAPR